MKAKNENMIVVEEKGKWRFCNYCRCKIGDLFSKLLLRLLPNSIIINEENFDKNLFEKIKVTQYVWGELPSMEQSKSLLQR